MPTHAIHESRVVLGAGERCYKLLRRLAIGGSSEVYLAHIEGHSGLRKLVAIKRLKLEQSMSLAARVALAREAHLLARIDHVNVVDVIELVPGFDPLLVLRYIAGPTLAECASISWPLVPLDVAASIIVGLLRGLHAVHEACTVDSGPLELVHSDVSPSNVIVGLDGVVRLCDLGVARSKLDRLEASGGYVPWGKLPYLAPEQLLGDEPDRRADIYAAATIFWELLVGRYLFARPSDDENISAIVRGAVPPPSKVAPRVEAPLEAVVMRGLSVNPADRFRTAAAMADAVEDVQLLASSGAVAKWLLADRARAGAHEGELEMEPSNDSHPPTSPARLVRRPDRGRS